MLFSGSLQARLWFICVSDLHPTSTCHPESPTDIHVVPTEGQLTQSGYTCLLQGQILPDVVMAHLAKLWTKCSLLVLIE